MKPLTCLTSILVCLVFLWGSAAPATANSYVEEEIEDLIDLVEADGEIIALVKGKKTRSIRLRSREEVLWRDSRGYLGAVLTNSRFCVISALSNSWKTIALRSDESEYAVASLSQNIALLATGYRALGFKSRSGRFIEARLPIDDELVLAEAEKKIAVVITSSRALGLTLKSSSFIQTSLRLRESVEDVRVTSSKATVQTSDRLLSLGARSGVWSEHRF
ncbi:MAG: hypothetical protein V6Z89_10290 [Desulfobacter sp.]